MKYIILWLSIAVNLSAQWEWKGNKLPVYQNQGWALDAYDSLNAVIAIIPQEPPYDQTLFITKDGGMNWEIQFDADSLTQFFNYIEMFDSLNGIAMGDSPDSIKPALFLKTTDGGKNWIQTSRDFINGASADIWRRISFINSSIGFFTPYGKPEYMNKIFKTTNSGENWVEVTENKGNVELIHFYDENYGLAYINLNNYGGKYIFKTADGGIHWDSTFITSDRLSMPGQADDFEFLPEDPSKVWFTTLDTIYFSSDSGKTWTKDNLSESFIRGRDLKIVNEKVCWFLCETVYRNLNANSIVSVDNGENSPSEFQLLQNYPNPFNPSTVVRYQLSVVSKITLKIFDILGREVEFLVDEEKPAGTYEVTWNAASQPSGVYFYQLKALSSNRQTASLIQMKKMILLK